MTFYGYDIPVQQWLEEAFVRYKVSPELLELFGETKAEKIPYSAIRLPYDFIFIETNDRINEEVEICGIMVSMLSKEDVEGCNDILIRQGRKNEIIPGDGGEFRLRPIYRINGFAWSPVEFLINKVGETIDDVNVTWNTMTSKASDIGLYEDHPLVKRSSWYCWLSVAMVCIYVTCSDADVVLGIDTKEYKKLSIKKNPKKAKLRQLKNTRYIGNNITIDRKIVGRKLSSKGGTHVSPVPHWRTGHFRHLQEGGRIVWIRPCIVGYGSGNNIPLIKKYLLK